MENSKNNLGLQNQTGENSPHFNLFFHVISLTLPIKYVFWEQDFLELKKRKSSNIYRQMKGGDAKIENFNI